MKDPKASFDYKTEHVTEHDGYNWRLSPGHSRQEKCTPSAADWHPSAQLTRCLVSFPEWEKGDMTFSFTNLKLYGVRVPNCHPRQVCHRTRSFGILTQLGQSRAAFLRNVFRSEGKISVLRHEDVSSSAGIALSFLTSALDGGQWWSSRPCRFSSGEIFPLTHWTGDLSGNQNGYGRCE
jgi:hypothetical protein